MGVGDWLEVDETLRDNIEEVAGDAVPDDMDEDDEDFDFDDDDDDDDEDEDEDFDDFDDFDDGPVRGGKMKKGPRSTPGRKGGGGGDPGSVGKMDANAQQCKQQ